MSSEPTISLIFKDKRGESYSIKLPNGRELVLIHSVKGAWRGGHYHTVPEVSLCLTGSIRYTKRYNEDSGIHRELTFVDKAGEMLFNDAYEPHVAHFLEDNWLIDWKLKEGPFETINVSEYRKFVSDSLKEDEEK